MFIFYPSGTCKCTSTLDVRFEGNAEVMLMHCDIVVREGTCGKRPLRQPYRTEVAEALMHKSAERHRIEIANDKMSPGDPEPPTLPKSNVLNAAKCEYLKSLQLDRDPVIAISKMKRVGRTEDLFTIRNIGYDPFYVQYWSRHQNVVYKKYAGRETASLKFDASGGFVSRLKRPDGNDSQHIFLYLGVINSEAGQFSVTQLLTEAHDTGTIQNWLVQWIRSGVPVPKETVADSSRALQTALVRTFTGYKTIEQYCDIFLTDELPDCYIRIDVAHFLKIYCNVLRGISRLVKKFYMGVIGKIILCTDLQSARKIIKNALIVSMNETEGVLGDPSSQTSCNIAKQCLINLITGQSPIDDVLGKLEEDSTVSPNETKECRSTEEEDTHEERRISKWRNWSNSLLKEIEMDIEDGLLPNAHYCKVFAKHLIADIQHIPMWSCISRNSFGYGRVPASSAPVEGEFNKLKHVDFDMKLGKLRVDKFLEAHIDLINGKSLIAEAKFGNEEYKLSGNVHDFQEDLEDLEQYSFNSFRGDENVPVSTKEEDNHVSEDRHEEDVIPKNKCPVCANGDEPSGAHSCAACDIFIHALEGCSVRLEDTSEGYGERRMCIACHQSKTANEVIASRYEENWRGLGITSKRRKIRASKYLNNEVHMFDALNFPKNLSIPVLKNGSHACGIVTKGTTTMGVTNTCAFDSVLQVLILAFAENEDLRESLDSNKNSFIQLALDIHAKGLKGRHAYCARTTILHDYIGHDKTRISFMDNCSLLDCAIGISYAILHSFRNDPSCEEISECQNGCTRTLKKRATITIPYSGLSKGDINETMEECLSLPARPCHLCKSMVDTTLTETGTAYK